MEPARGTDEERVISIHGPDTFESFFQDHHRDVYAAMWLITRDRQESEEIIQDAFLRMWERWDRVGSLDDPEGYLYRTAMNVFRSRKRRAALAIRRIGHAPAPDDLLDSIERREVLVQALASLTPRERAAVVLTDVLGFSSEEAAQALGIKSATVRVLASRGRGRMHQEVTDDDT
ncbi:MAG: sigma-70 family RNA polymerase sigma factor [Actinomycetota bacterium]